MWIDRVDRQICQTFAASPAEPGELPLGFRRAGGPDKFLFNVLRHTASTFLQNAGHSQWERDLILNHVGCGTTSDYSHGHALALKGELLREWADHIQGLVTPAGAVRLR